MSAAPDSPPARIGVVVPVHDEEELLPGCLAGLRRAVAVLGPAVAVEVLVVLDSCSDASAEIAHAAGVRTLVVAHRNVGAVRRAGFAALVDRHGGAGHWLCTTDADSEVPARWLVGQLAAARQGWDALVGTVTVADWAGYPARLRRRYQRAYSSQWGHPHVHGANLGVRARSYLDVGGMPPLPNGEDTALVARLAAAGCRILRTPRTPVRTSARRRGRASAGFAAHLATLGDDQRATG